MPEPTSEADQLAAALRQPAEWTKTGGIRGPQPGPSVDPNRRSDQPPGSVTRRQSPTDWPPARPTVEELTTAGTILALAFALSNASTTAPSGEVTYKVKVFDGKINGTFPDGMGFGNYVLTVAEPANSIIWAGATFDPTSLEMTSRFMQVTTPAESPESRIDEEGGFLYWQIGFVYQDAQGQFKIVNTRVGDINNQLVYGAFNGKPALLPVESGPGWLDLEFYETPPP